LKVIRKEEMVTSDDDAPMIGVIDAGTRTVQFCVFRSQHTQEIAGHAIDITQHTPQEGWFEEDPNEILQAVRTCMYNVVNQLGDKGEVFLWGQGLSGGNSRFTALLD
jgi:glycerol kinase